MPTTFDVPMIDDLFSPEDFAARVDAGYVRVRSHPEAPLAIANYTSRAAYGRVWDDVTRTCRGLVWNTATREIVARPFAKFFDLHETAERVPDSPPVAHEKLDGSLGVLSLVDGCWSVATRGSFDGPQAEWATAHLRQRYQRLAVPDGVTPLVEIVYPHNRIVVDHGRREDLVLLGAIDIRTGADIPLWEVDWWPGQRADQHVVASAHDGYLKATSNAFENAEGLVLTWYRPDRPSLRVKVKHPRYVELHRVVFGTSARDVWRSVVVGDWRDQVEPSAIARVLDISTDKITTVPLVEEILPVLPTDLQPRLLAVEADLRAQHQAVLRYIDELWSARPSGDRRTFAQWAGPTGHASLLFSRLDNHPWQLQAWSSCRPPANPLFTAQGADE